ncbi:MAG: hypothetical protein WD971_00500 [Pirellulales bacterium]
MIWLLVVLLSGSVGCGGGGPFDYVPISGTVTYEDGTNIPLSSMRLLFSPLDAPEVAGAHPRRAMANVSADGAFDCVTSYKYGDGLIPGSHKVVIEAAAALNGRPLIPAACASEVTTPLVIDTADAPLHIKVPKP